MNIHERLRLIREGDIIEPSGKTLDFTITDENEFQNSSWIVESYELFESLSGFDALLESSDLFLETREESGSHFKVFISYIKEKIAKFLNWMMAKFKGTYESKVQAIKKQLSSINTSDLKGTIAVPENLEAIEEIKASDIAGAFGELHQMIQRYMSTGDSKDIMDGLVGDIANDQNASSSDIRKAVKHNTIEQIMRELFDMKGLVTEKGEISQSVIDSQIFGDTEEVELSEINTARFTKGLDSTVGVFNGISSVKSTLVSKLGQLERTTFSPKLKDNERRRILSAIMGAMDAMLTCITFILNIFWKALDHFARIANTLVKSSKNKE